MITRASLICLALIVASFLVTAPLSAQVTSQGVPGSTDQWKSHQMNQPAPGADRYTVSQDRLEDIRQLYLQAKKDLTDKTEKKPQDKK
jgi:hypothetical protein